ncbi:MAG TPA: class I SAM-dependent methyltransferase [Solirubrobacteraceae bacterium]
MTSATVLWHDLECGAYTVDLSLWQELAAAAGGAVLDVGAGTGRVALDLARAGVSVTALDHDPELLAALEDRAGGLPVETVRADARDFALDRRFALILAPMQTVQLLGGAAGRLAFLRCAAAHLAPGGRLACALADALEAFDPAGGALPVPDMRDEGDRVVSSQPVRVRQDGDAWVIERVRQIVSARGEVEASDDTIRLDAVDPATLEAEAAVAGLVAEPRRRVPETADHVGSEVVIARRG